MSNSVIRELITQSAAADLPEGMDASPSFAFNNAEDPLLALEQAIEERAVEYKTLVRMVSIGHRVDAANVLDMLNQMGVSFEAFKVDVQSRRNLLSAAG
jgi:hypothetical protein